MGHKIINLPEKKEVDLLVPLSAEEQCIAQYVRTSFIRRIKRIFFPLESSIMIFNAKISHYRAVKEFYEGKIALLEKGELDQDEYEAAIGGLDEADEAKDEKSSPQKPSAKANVWTMRRSVHIRRRQATSHTFCIERLLRYSFEVEELKALIDALEGVATPKRTIFEQIRALVDTDGGISNYETGLQILQERDEAMFGRHFDMRTILRLTLDESSVRGITCRLCTKAKPPADPVRAVVSGSDAFLAVEDGLC